MALRFSGPSTSEGNRRAFSQVVYEIFHLLLRPSGERSHACRFCCQLLELPSGPND